jgi:hypothetical protein
MKATRTMAIVAGVVLLVLLSAAFVRELALASEQRLSWPLGAPWRALIEGSALRAALGAVLVGCVGALCLVAAFRLLAPRTQDVQIEFGQAGGSTRADAAALEHVVRRGLQRAVPGLVVSGVSLAREREGWGVTVAAQVPAVDLEALHRRLVAVARDEFRRVGGLDLAALELEVRGCSSDAAL